jgi:two-component system CheB/CheR fusion protein
VSTQRREAQADPEALKSLLDFLKEARGFDFSGYKTSSLERRIWKRMSEVGVGDYARYQDYLEVNPGEFTDLFNTILINVTGFFRDPPAWDYIADELVPQLLAEVPDPQPIRVWSAGCATGEEPYTAAMVLANALGEEAFRRRVKIYGTDIDEEALTRARQAAYSRDAVKDLPADLLAGYFEEGPLGYTFRADLRRTVIFGRNDLVQDAPISRIDLLLSRNALMYFTPETQSRILAHYNFALKETGFLFLGKSEMLITHTDLFVPHNLKWRVFKKVPRRGMRERLAFVEQAAGVEAERAPHYTELRNAAIDMGPVAQVVIDRNGVVTTLNGLARTMFGLGPSEVGRPLQDLELSYRPLELRSGLEQAYAERRAVTIGRAGWTVAGEPRTIEVRVTPVSGAGGGTLGAIVGFHDVTEVARLDAEYERSKRQLETAYEELQSTVEELETTNEELHSTNEELETTNEELQSSNEELETMNEELQSTNDELEALNDEHARRTVEMDRLNLFLEGILANLGMGVVVVDRDERVQVWNAGSTDLWGLRPDEAEGEELLGLDLGLPMAELREPVRAALSGGDGGEVALAAVTRRGHPVECTVRTQPLRDRAGALYGALLLMSVADPAGGSRRR